jgi:hypothetical protein
MNYIELINQFWKLDELWQFNGCETRLYFYILKIANMSGWADAFEQTDLKVSAAVGVSTNTLKSAQKRLVKSGLISIETGGKCYGNKSRYKVSCQILIANSVANSVANNKNKNKTKTIIPPNPPEGSEDKKIDFNFFISKFNEICHSLPRVENMSDDRKKKLKARLDKYGHEKLMQAFELAERSDFLSGRSGKWRASFDWIICPTNFIKILEKNYDNRSKNLFGAIHGSVKEATDEYTDDLPTS